MKDKKNALFVMTVDTEEEWDWNGKFPREKYSVQNIRRIPKFQKFCNDLGVKPTYLVDYAVVSSKHSLDCLKKPLERGECEIGAHLHPWCTPPIEEEINEENSHIVNLPEGLVARKLKNLTKKIEDEFGKRPYSFRSGRWGTNEKILKLLSEQGYKIDTSVFPFYSDSTFSYDDTPIVPYWPGFTNFRIESPQRDIFEIPVSSGFNFSNFTLCNKIHRFLSKKPLCHFRILGLSWHLGLFRKLQLSPEIINASNMISCIEACLSQGNSLINMYLHSSSLLPGVSKYVLNKNDEMLFYKNIEAVINYLKTNTNVIFCTLTEAKERYLESIPKFKALPTL